MKTEELKQIKILQDQVRTLIKLNENYSRQIENFNNISETQTRLLGRLMQRITRVENEVFDLDFFDSEETQQLQN